MMLLSRKRVLLSGVMILCFLVLAACGSGSSNSNGNTNNNSNQSSNNSNATNNEETIVLKGLTAWDENNVYSAAFKVFKDIVEGKSNGRVQIEYVGGPEAVPAFNQGDAIRNGTVDFSIISATYFSSFPEAVVLNFSELTPEEERESGALDYLNKLAAERMNGIILGRGDDLEYSLYLMEPIERMEDIKNLRIRATTAYLGFLEAMGAQVISMPHGEIYTALERGVIDGFALGVVGVTDLGVETLIKAQIAPGYNRVDVVNMMNLDKYNSLPADIQELLLEAAIETEKEMIEINRAQVEAENEALRAAGVQVVEIENPEEYRQFAFDASWEWVLNNIENGEELQKYFRK